MKQSIHPILISTIILACGILMSYTFMKNFISTATYTLGSIDGYHLSRPEFRLELPKILHEISGLTQIDNNTVACIQDEDGIVFIYDLEKNVIKNKINFGKAGDYEDITRIVDTLYILRSDGRLFEVSDYKSAAFHVQKYDTNIPINNNEGLTYDIRNNRLLIAGKSSPYGDKYKNSKAIFAFDLSTKTISEEPVYEFNLAKIKQFILDYNKDNSKQKDGLKINIYPSAIAIHPHTDKVFVLSAKNYLIYIFDQKGDIEAIHSLNKKMFTQAEGITFFENGDMLISNEGKNGKPTILHFPYGR